MVDRSGRAREGVCGCFLSVLYLGRRAVDNIDLIISIK